ncbi:MAG TPA: hypothetical protein VFA09_22935, partial [Ktedonobacteraceae bacterium]|nr:hypothetical protein [Ktedonobacteraceae bacterium]
SCGLLSREALPPLQQGTSRDDAHPLCSLNRQLSCASLLTSHCRSTQVPLARIALLNIVDIGHKDQLVAGTRTRDIQ